MQIKITKTKTITFQVEYFEELEGGMATGSYGLRVDTLEAAVDLLDQALVAEPSRDWVVTAHVQTSITKEPK